MKILYVVLDAGIPLRGVKGASVHVRALAGALAETGHNVTIITRNIEGSEPLPPGVNVVKLSTGNATELASVYPEARSELLNIFLNTEAYRAITELISAEQPNAVLERLSLFSIAALAASRKADVPYLLEVDAPLADEAATHRRLQLYETAHVFERALVCGADIVLPVSTTLRDWTLELGATLERVHVLANGVDIRLFDPLHTKDRRQELGFEDAYILGFVGGLRPWHGVNLLMETFDLLAARNPQIRLIVVGDGPARENLERWRRKNGLSERVMLMGRVPQAEVPGLLSTMDVVLAPYEDLQGFYFSPLKVLESMAMGRPTVAAAIGDIPNLIKDGNNGILVPPGDAQALAKAVERLLDEPEFAAHIGKAARESVVRDHDWLCVARRVTEWVRAAREARC